METDTWRGEGVAGRGVVPQGVGSHPVTRGDVMVEGVTGRGVGRRTRCGVPGRGVARRGKTWRQGGGDNATH